MEEIDPKIETLRFPANFVISGATGSGKTSLLLKFLTEWPFKCKRGRIFYFYNTWQPLYECFLHKFDNITFVQGLNLEKLDHTHEEDDSVKVCVVDDLADYAVKSEDFARLFTVLGHHHNMINFFITQNIYTKGSMATNISRNTHYFVLTKTPHLNVLDVLSTQLYGQNGPIKPAYIACMKERPYNYLLIDVFNDNIESRLRSNIFSDEQPMIIWRL